MEKCNYLMQRASFLYHMEKLIENYLLVRNHFLDGDNLKCLYRLINSTDIQEPLWAICVLDLQSCNVIKVNHKNTGQTSNKKIIYFRQLFPCSAR